MNQFKPIFLGQVDPSSPLSTLKSAVNSQKCIRAGGKHNDLDDVGLDTYHHTFFEMLGNWSFASYYKQEAIAYAYDLLVNVYHLPVDRLYATYFQGDESLGLPVDNEAKEIWLKYLPESRVLPFDKKDNFWEMGDTGPCGPCSEIHYDRIGGRDASKLVNADDPNCIEIWNLVFIAYNREASGQLASLPHKHIDTGMGFERLTSILQGKMSNYDTDVFMPLFGAIQNATGSPQYGGKLGKEDSEGVDMAYRVVADHIRTLSIAITDGAVPSNEGRGYVLRRILRRAVRYGRQFLSAKVGFFAQLVDVVAENMSGFFPELEKKKAYVKEIIEEEERTFATTLDKGTEKFATIVKGLREKGQKVVPGSDAFFLYDTMGFPLDLTQRMAEEQDMTVDVDGYEEAMTTARKRSQQDRSLKSGLGGVDRLTLEADETDSLQKNGVKPTDDSGKYNRNYTPLATVEAIFAGASKGFITSTANVSSDTNIGIILDATSFYAEAGGQIGDTGELRCKDSGPVFIVQDCQVQGGYVVHLGRVKGAPEKPIQVGTVVECAVDYERRSRIAPNHTMTHILNYALKEVLKSDNLDQKGSLVDGSKLRFDFSHTKALTPTQIEDVENLVKQKVQDKLKVHTAIIPLSDAKAINSLRAVFGETYPDPVRVVSIGEPVEKLVEDPKNSAWSALSIELCGGTHLANTEEAGDFVLVEESGISKGVRRIVAITSKAAKKASEEGEGLAQRVADLEKVSDDSLAGEIAALNPVIDSTQLSSVEKTRLRKALGKHNDRARAIAKEQQKKALNNALVETKKASEKAKELGNKYIVLRLDELNGDGKLLNKVITQASSDWSGGSIMLVSGDSKKNRVAVCAGGGELDAKEWVATSISPVGGKGGGKKASAQGQAKLESFGQITTVVEASNKFAGS
eukprot:Plantae.Rhodophyta-Hildenbrandia_rubra.ctg4910.p1 GENE.Plantae.Rhodophyta-Hildenbrandia_rubra.ctg4910~~Plantae.Rhodophyta-Hildenbrandia_rubra.ctg4910.p1  ORF type:complete len:914 (+),score=212.20 Plantae.Rhodophyta-Hildenbrandia_rubra.ctg4910:373-3114(+)